MTVPNSLAYNSRGEDILYNSLKNPHQHEPQLSMWASISASQQSVGDIEKNGAEIKHQSA